MNLTKNKLNIGATAPFSFLHMSDTHFSLADDRDDERKNELAKNRFQAFFNAENEASEAEEFAQENGILICHTGDFIDFVSEKNLDRLRDFTEKNDVFMAAGNHEFSLYVGEAWEDADYRNKSLDKVQSCVKNDFRFSSCEVNGVNLIAIDNGYYLFEQWQLNALKEEAKKGLPMILFMHTPLYDEKLIDIIEEKNCKGDAWYMVATPEDKMSWYSDDRLRQQKADAATLETVEYIKSEPLVKAIFCGHFHDFTSETKLTEHITQYISNHSNMRLVEVE